MRKTVVFFDEIEHDVNGALKKICESPNNLILILSRERYPAVTYDFVVTLLLHKTKHALSYLIVENDLSSITNTTRGYIVLENSAATILKGVSDLPEDTPIERCRFILPSTRIGNQMALGPRKASDLIKHLTGTNIQVETYKLNGLDLQKGEAIHDLQVLFRRNNRSKSFG